ncbi:uncharacterized protein [Asterias amurensis]|uniref:uncharacterized protein isoform X1 n=1 Tax=Asterias amurensis TaxID=7602 RepID=UPI003AB8FBAB
MDMSSPTRSARGRPRKTSSGQKRKLKADKIQRRKDVRQRQRQMDLLESAIGKTNSAKWIALRDTSVVACSGDDDDESFARLLLERYEESLLLKPRQHYTSTPVQGKQECGHVGSDVISSIGTAETLPSGVSSKLSGVQELEPVESTQPQCSTEQSTNQTLYDISVDYYHDGKYIYPVEDCSGSEEEGDQDSDDEEFQPYSSLTISFEDCDESMDDLQEMSVAEEVFDVEEEAGEDHTDDDEYGDPGKDEQSSCPDMLVSQRCYIVYHDNLQNLCDSVKRRCSVKGCLGDAVAQIKQRGSSVTVHWRCQRNHACGRWIGQPQLNGVNMGDLAMSAAIMFSGNQYAKIKMMCHVMKLGLPYETLYYQIQRNYLLPCISNYWNQLQGDVLSKRQGKEVVICGDARNDSPGFSAKYCTYTVLDVADDSILSMAFKDKRQCGGKSPNMEAAAFTESLDDLKEKIHIVEVCTDSHTTIAKIMRERYTDIKHSFDVWHAAKNLSKRLCKVAKKAGNRKLLPWTSDIVTHFWKCSELAGGNPDVFLMRWRGILHHVTGQHRWMSALGEGYGPVECSHGELPPNWDSKILTAGSPEHKALSQIVLDKSFLKKIPHYVNFRHTGKLESFHNHILMYCSKRFAYSGPVYTARNYLAAIDYTMHLHREQMKTANGKLKYHRAYSKHSQSWVVKPVMQKKKYNYLTDLMVSVFQARLDDTQLLRRKTEMLANDPRRIASTIAPIPPPPTEELVAKHQSRFSTS